MAPLPHSVSPRHTQVADNGRLSEPTDYHPPTEISTDDGTVNILQLTDLHLYFDTPKATHEQDINKDLAHQTITGICQNSSAKRGNPTVRMRLTIVSHQLSIITQASRHV
nr:hypothetical protein [Psychrobacter sp. PraFG1]UNK05545.1 hypothetical protein MN210_01170 [Psychrobacter sp. PraFG1]